MFLSDVVELPRALRELLARHLELRHPDLIHRTPEQTGGEEQRHKPVVLPQRPQVAQQPFRKIIDVGDA